VSPVESTISLSIPRGPRVVRTASTIAWQAFMLLISCGLPCDVSVPSFSKMIGACYISTTRNTTSMKSNFHSPTDKQIILTLKKCVPASCLLLAASMTWVLIKQIHFRKQLWHAAADTVTHYNLQW